MCTTKFQSGTSAISIEVAAHRLQSIRATSAQIIQHKPIFVLHTDVQQKQQRITAEARAVGRGQEKGITSGAEPVRVSADTTSQL